MRLRKLLLYSLFSIIAVTNIRCGIETVVAAINVIEVAADLMSAIKQLNELTGLFKNNIEQLDETAAQNVKNETNIKDTYQQYEQQWETIRSNYSDLNNQLQIIKDTSDRLFEGLWDNNHQIINETRKLKDSVKNAELQARWNKEFSKAAKSLADAKGMMDDGNDVERQLQNAAGRADLSDYLGSLEGIAEEARQLSQKIETFKINADKLLNIEGVSADDNTNDVYPTVRPPLQAEKDSEATISNHTESNPDISCSISNLAIEDSTDQLNQKGIRVSFFMNVSNMANINGRCVAYFYNQDGSPVKSLNQNFITQDGQLSSGANFTPLYPNTNYDKFSVFVPNSAMDLPEGPVDLKVMIKVYQTSGVSEVKTLAQSDFLLFSRRY